MAETRKAHARRLASGWFDQFCPADRPGLDIGCGDDPVHATFRQWEKKDGDASRLEGVPDGVFSSVYASHVLEHLPDPEAALQNWYRVLAPGGHLTVVVPAMDVYEVSDALPSVWNAEHKTYWVPDRPMPPVRVCGWSEAPKLPGHRITVAADAPWKGDEFYPLVDGPGNNPAVFAAAVEAVRRASRRGPTVVHCIAGVSRSAAVAAAAVALECGLSAEDALAVVRAARPQADPCPALRELLAGLLADPPPNLPAETRARSHVRGLRETIAATLPDAQVVWSRLPDPEPRATRDRHAGLEYSIELTVRKPSAHLAPADILIVSASTPDYVTGIIAAANHARFAELAGHRQEFHSDGFDPDRPPAWSKLKFVRNALDCAPWVCWIDADAVFVRVGDLAGYCDPAADLVLAVDANGVNTGVFFVRASDWSRVFLDRVWAMGEHDPWRSHPWWEQAAINHLVLTDTRRHVRLVPFAPFNAYPHESPFTPDALVYHCPGRADKETLVREWAKKLPAAHL